MPLPYEPGDALTVQQIRELDVLAIEHVGLPGAVLMENAGAAAAEFIYSTLVNPPAANLLILCGSGNNGGDGLVIARRLHNAGVRVEVALAAPREKLQGDAAINLAICERMDIALHDCAERVTTEVNDRIEASDALVDALLGTGATGAPRGLIAELVTIANRAARPTKFAIDAPTGLDADSGELHNPCFQADATVTMLAAKVGFTSHAARTVLGRLVVVDIGLPRELVPGRRNHPTALDR